MDNIKKDYPRAYASCVALTGDDDYLSQLVANASSIKAPFVVVKGFTNYDFDIPKYEPMPFDEASEKFKTMNSNTVSFWIVFKSGKEADKLAIFPFYYDRTGQKNGEYHDLRSFIKLKLNNASLELEKSIGKYSGHAHLPGDESIACGYLALEAVDAYRFLDVKDYPKITVSKKSESCCDCC